MSLRDSSLSFDPNLLERLFRDPIDYIESAKKDNSQKLVIASNKAICQSMVAHDDYDPQHYSFRYETSVDGTTWKGECWVEYIGDKTEKR